jgi:hypothetical protein
MWSVLGGKWSFSAKSAAKRWCSVVPSLSGAPPAPSLIANAGSSSRSLTEKTRLGPEAKDWSDVYGRTASPLYADLSGLPPLLIVVGVMRRCSTTRCAWRARRAWRGWT